MAISVKLRWKRYLSELRFVYEDLAFVKEICRTGASEFQTHYEEFCARNQIDINSLNKQHSQRIQDLYNKKKGPATQQDAQLETNSDGALIPHDSAIQKNISSENDEDNTQQLCEYEMTKDEMEIHESFNKIFRKLAMKLHPDKLSDELSPPEREDKLKMFKEAKDALEKRKYFVLLDMAQDFGIALPRNYKQQIRWMKKELRSLSGSLKKEKDTYNYLFSECETDEEKDKIVKRFMHQIFGPQIFEIIA